MERVVSLVLNLVRNIKVLRVLVMDLLEMVKDVGIQVR